VPERRKAYWLKVEQSALIARQESAEGIVGAWHRAEGLNNKRCTTL
jgi:hypothetical protein